MLENLIQAYLDNLKSAIEDSRKTKSATPELSFRPYLDQFIRGCCRFFKPDEPVTVVFEPSATHKGRPDFRLHDQQTYGIYGYIECKPMSEEDMDWGPYQEQIGRYCELGYPVILTDGLEFLFFEPGDCTAPKITVCIVNSKKRFLHGQSYEIVNIDSFRIVFRTFLHVKLPRIVDLGTLTELLARRARFLRDDVLMLLRGNFPPDSNEAVVAEQLRQVFKVFQKQLDRTLTEDTFASVVGQILIFSLLIAYRQIREGITQEKLTTFFAGDSTGANYPPLRALCEILQSENCNLGVINAGWTDAALLLSYVKLRDESCLDDYHRVYEEFHSKYDPDERIDFGAYATPASLAAYIVGLCDEILGDARFGERALTDPSVRIIDPGCGTGTFLEQLTLYCLRKEKKKVDLEHAAGIEILPVPYALAQMRLGALARQNNLENVPRIYMGNSLSNAVVNPETLVTPIAPHEPPYIQLLKGEHNRVIERTRPPLMVVFGNPPVSDTGLNMGEEFTEIEIALDAFRPPEEERTGRQNIQKSLQNDFVKFLRWACLKIDRFQGGVISFVVPDSALVDRSYKYMRLFLLNDYDAIFILVLDMDKRKFSKGLGESLFPTQQGRAVLTVVKYPQKEVLFGQRNSAKLHYASIAELPNRTEKEKWLKEQLTSGSLLSSYTSFEPIGDLRAFRPVSDRGLERYRRFSAIDDLFFYRVSGVKTACTSLVVHSDKEGLKRVINDYINENISDEELFNRYFRGQAKTGAYVRGWKRAWMAKYVIQEDGVKDSRIFRYDFRPFIRRYVYYYPAMMNENSGARPRPELERLCDRTKNCIIGIAVAQSPAQLGVELDEFTSYVSVLPDNDVVRRGNAFIFPIWFAPRADELLVRNIKSKVLQALPICSSAATLTEEQYDQVARQFLYYVYAVTKSAIYRETFRDLIYYGLLKGFARIPITADANLFKELAELGRELATVEAGEVSPPSSFQLTPQIVGLEELPAKINGFSVEPDNQRIVLKTEGGVYVEIKSVPGEVLKHRVNGYDVVPEWLKYKTSAYLHRAITRADLEELTQVLSAINTHLGLQTKLNQLVEQVLRGELVEINPSDETK